MPIDEDVERELRSIQGQLNAIKDFYKLSIIYVCSKCNKKGEKSSFIFEHEKETGHKVEAICYKTVK